MRPNEPRAPKRTEFDHERLIAYQKAKLFVSLADRLTRRLPKSRAYLADQLHRAASSIMLNIAEGAGEFSPKEKARFYRIAKRSTTESAAILDVMESYCADLEEFPEGRELLLELTALVIGLVASAESRVR